MEFNLLQVARGEICCILCHLLPLPMLLRCGSADFTRTTGMAWSTCPCTVPSYVTVLWGLILKTRVSCQHWGAKDESPCQPHIVKEVEFTSCKRLCALATDCSAHLNQPWRPRSHLADGRARRTRAESKTSMSHGGCGERPRSSSSRRHRFLFGWSR